MVQQILIALILLMILCGCDSRQQEEALQKRETALNEREQLLLLKEKSLQLREEALLKQKSFFDSTINTDTTYLINTQLQGKWDVRMTCTEATCPGSAVGDVKTEQWELAYQGNKLIAKAMSNNQLVRVYTGFYTGNTIELVEDVTGTEAASLTKMVVRLRLVDNFRLEGEREIIRDNNCKVVYTLLAEKLNA
jgi:hypothetical protein